MKRRILTVTLLAVVSLPARDAPERPFRYQGSGPILFGAGSNRAGPSLHVGGGGEVLLFRDVSLEGDLGCVTFTESPTRLGIAACDVGYYFVDREFPAHLDRFVTAGIPAYFFSEDGTALAGRIGGGFASWSKRRIGLRTEYHLYSTLVPEMAVHLFRVGHSLC